MDRRKTKFFNHYWVEFLEIPPLGSSKSISGKAAGIYPYDHKIALYIYMPDFGWVTKPCVGNPNTVINDDGTWSVEYAHNQLELNATKFAAFLLHKSCKTPVVNPARSLPPELFSNCITYIQTNR